MQDAYSGLGVEAWIFLLCYDMNGYLEMILVSLDQIDIEIQHNA